MALQGPFLSWDLSAKRCHNRLFLCLRMSPPTRPTWSGQKLMTNTTSSFTQGSWRRAFPPLDLLKTGGHFSQDYDVVLRVDLYIHSFDLKKIRAISASLVLAGKDDWPHLLIQQGWRGTQHCHGDELGQLWFHPGARDGLPGGRAPEKWGSKMRGEQCRKLSEVPQLLRLWRSALV